jgi:hypothetical protein
MCGKVQAEFIPCSGFWVSFFVVSHGLQNIQYLNFKDWHSFVESLHNEGVNWKVSYFLVRIFTKICQKITVFAFCWGSLSWLASIMLWPVTLYLDNVNCCNMTPQVLSILIHELYYFASLGCFIFSNSLRSCYSTYCRVLDVIPRHNVYEWSTALRQLT